jgi:hypothetical protein
MNEPEQFTDAAQPDQIKSNPGWPTVLGVIGIVWASLGLLSSGCFMLLSPERIASWLPEDQREQMLAEFGQQSSLQDGLQILSLVLTILLLWGSISLLKRQASSRQLLNVWAGLSVLLVVILTPMTILEQLDAAQATETTAAEVDAGESDATEETAGSDDPSMADLPPEATKAITVVSGACGGVVGLIWPIIVLCFINSRSGRQTIAGWKF